MIADRIRMLRETKALTQTEFAKHLGITRSGVSAWEMGIFVSSTQYILEGTRLFQSID